MVARLTLKELTERAYSSCPFIRANMAEEEDVTRFVRNGCGTYKSCFESSSFVAVVAWPRKKLTELVVDNDSGKAGYPRDDAPRAVPSGARHDGWYEPEGRKIRHHRTTTDSGLPLKNIPFCPRARDADHV